MYYYHRPTDIRQCDWTLHQTRSVYLNGRYMPSEFITSSLSSSFIDTGGWRRQVFSVHNINIIMLRLDDVVRHHRISNIIPVWIVSRATLKKRLTLATTSFSLHRPILGAFFFLFGDILFRLAPNRYSRALLLSAMWIKFHANFLIRSHLPPSRTRILLQSSVPIWMGSMRPKDSCIFKTDPWQHCTVKGSDRAATP